MKTAQPPIGVWDDEIDPRLHPFPGWGDAGRQVEIENDRVRIAGELRIDDWGDDGEDEFPIFTVRDAEGRDHSFAGSDRWRFLN